ncbi:MAG: hypothetical protein V4666_01185 [Bacteroidota bacterium]
MRKTICVLTILTAMLSVSSCDSKNEKSNQSVVEKNIQESTPIVKKNTETTSTELKLSLDDFKSFPEDIVGCSYYFSENDKKFKNDEFLFVADFDSIGFISVNKKTVKLKLVSTTREPNTFGNIDHTDIYESELYKVTLEIKYKDSNGYETWWNDGTLTVENKDGKKMSKKFVGECGC